MRGDRAVVAAYGRSGLGSQAAREGQFLIDSDGPIPERDLSPDEEVLRAHGYTVDDLPAPWERLRDAGEERSDR